MCRPKCVRISWVLSSFSRPFVTSAICRIPRGTHRVLAGQTTPYHPVYVQAEDFYPKTSKGDHNNPAEITTIQRKSHRSSGNHNHPKEVKHIQRKTQKSIGGHKVQRKSQKLQQKSGEIAESRRNRCLRRVRNTMCAQPDKMCVAAA